MHPLEMYVQFKQSQNSCDNRKYICQNIKSTVLHCLGDRTNFLF